MNSTWLASPRTMAGIAVDGKSVYWSDSQIGVMKMPLGGGRPVTLVSGLFSGAMTIDSVNVYYAPTNESPTKNTIVKIPIEGGVPTSLAPTTDGFPPPDGSLVSNGTNVAWIQPSSSPIAIDGGFANQTAVMTVPVGGGAVTTLASGQAAFGIAIDARNVYWTNAADGSVISASIADGRTQILAVKQQDPGAIAVDGTSVYWTTYTAIMKAPLTGGQSVSLVSDPNSPIEGSQYISGAIGALIVAGTSVFYFTATGTLMKTTVDGAPPMRVPLPAIASLAAIDASNVYWFHWVDAYGGGPLPRGLFRTPLP